MLFDPELCCLIDVLFGVWKRGNLIGGSRAAAAAEDRQERYFWERRPFKKKKKKSGVDLDLWNNPTSRNKSLSQSHFRVILSIPWNRKMPEAAWRRCALAWVLLVGSIDAIFPGRQKVTQRRSSSDTGLAGSGTSRDASTVWSRCRWLLLTWIVMHEKLYLSYLERCLQSSGPHPAQSH